jgi:hypothetical protein
MKTLVVAILCCITMAGMLAYAQSADEGYQTATVVSIEKLAADAQHMEKGDQYKISMSMGGMVYLCKDLWQRVSREGKRQGIAREKQERPDSGTEH